MATGRTVANSEPKHKRLALNVRDAGTLFGLVAISVVFGVLAPDFLTPHNLVNILQQSSINACVAIGMTLVIISGGIDLSVGPTAALSAVLTAMLMTSGVPVVIALLAGLAVGLVCGFLNGALISFAGLQPFIVTLGTLSLYRALALIFTGGNPILGLPNGFRDVLNTHIGIVPVPVIIVAVLSVMGWLLLRKAPIGGAYRRRSDRAHEDHGLYALGCARFYRGHDPYRPAGRCRARARQSLGTRRYRCFRHRWGITHGRQGKYRRHAPWIAGSGSHAQRADTDGCPGLLSVAGDGNHYHRGHAR
jgi:hypothetical protein